MIELLMINIKLLFLIYINDVFMNIVKSDVKIIG